MLKRLAVKVYGYPQHYNRDDLVEVARRNCSLEQMAQNNSPPFDIIFTCTTEHDAHLLAKYLRGIRYIANKSVNLETEHIMFNPAPGTLVPPVQQPQQARPQRPNMAPLRPLNNGQHSSQNGPGASASSRTCNGFKKKSESLEKIRKSVRSILACSKNGLDPLRFINDYQDLCNENFFDSIKREGYRDMTEFINDNLDTVDFEVWNNGGSVVLHGVADAKSKHIFDMNKHTRNKKRPNLKPLPIRMKHFFGNFTKSTRVQAEQFNQANKPPGLPEVNKRRIVAIIKEHPNGITERDFQSEYLEKFEEPINLTEMRRFTGLWTLQDILSTVEEITLQPVANGVSRWMMCRQEEPRPAEPEREPAMPRDITKTPQFVKLVSDITTFIKRTPEYRVMMADIQKSHLKIDCAQYGKATLQELISLVPDIHMKRKGGEWIIYLAQEEQGDDLPYAVKDNIYSLLNSDGNGFLLAEFDQAYQRYTGSRLNPRDYNYKSLWHLLQHNTELCMIQSIEEGLLLLAGTKPTPPPNQLTPSRNTSAVAQPQPVPAVDTRRNFSTPPMFSNIEPPSVGVYEKDLGYHPFKEDGGHLLIYISVIYSPNEFYCLPWADERLKKEHNEQRATMKQYYTVYSNKTKHQIRDTVLGVNMLCVFSDEHDQWHRVVVDRSSHTDVIGVRSIDSGKRFEAPISSVYRLADKFRQPCYARRCSLYGIKPFNSTTWSPESDAIFGQVQSTKFYYARLEALENEIMEFTIIDTHGDEDRNFSEVLEAEGLAEFVQAATHPNNTPSNDAAEVAPVVEDLDDSWLENWIDGSDEEAPAPSPAAPTPVMAPTAAPLTAPPGFSTPTPAPVLPQPALTSTQLQLMTYDQICELKYKLVNQRVELAQLLRADVSQTHLYSAVDRDIQLIDQFLNAARAAESKRAEPTNLWETHATVSPTSTHSPSILNVTDHGHSMSNQLQQIGKSMEEVALSQSFATAAPNADSNNFLLNLMKNNSNNSLPIPATNTVHPNLSETVATSHPHRFGGHSVVKGRGMHAPPPSSFKSIGRGTSR